MRTESGTKITIYYYTKVLESERQDFNEKSAVFITKIANSGENEENEYI